MNRISLIEDLFGHNAWANRRVCELAGLLPDGTLDEPREIGFGTLRNTIFHILAAEEVWLARGQGLPRRPFPLDAEGIPVAEMGQRLIAVHKSRARFLADAGASGLAAICQYEDSKGNRRSNRLEDLMVHVANHGIHHRAQALHFLKRAGKTVPGGLDYIFYRLARPALRQLAETAKVLAGYGLEIGTAESKPLDWDAALAARYFAYGDWANAKLWRLLETLSSEQLDRDLAMGVGTIRKTALHIFDAERFWFGNWTIKGNRWKSSPETVTIAELRTLWPELIDKRNSFLSSLNPDRALDPVEASFGGPPVMIPIAESAMQLCGHGTHHRAQAINMMKQLGATAPPMDYVVFARENQHPQMQA